MAERPGIMLYFDMADPLKGLGYEEKGRLLEAMLDYGQFGVVPEFGGYLSIAWAFIRPKLDADAKSYRKKVVKNTYSSYCAREKKNGNNAPMDLEEWCAREGIDTTEWTQSVSTDIERYPTTTSKTETSTTTKPKTETSTKANSTTGAKANADGGGKGEEEPPKEKDFEALRHEKLAMLTGVR